MTSPARGSVRTPLTTSRKLAIPSAPSSPAALPASRRGPSSGRLTRTTSVCPGSAKASTALWYCSRWASKPRQGTEAARAAGCLLKVGAPGPGQAQQPKGVAGRSGVEHHVVEAGRRWLPHQSRERVEGGDLHGALSGELLLERAHLRLGDRAAVGVDHAPAIRGGDLLGIEVRHPEVGDLRHPGWFLARRHVEDATEVRRWIRAHEEDPSSRVRQTDRDGRLADPALPGEEQVAAVEPREVSGCAAPREPRGAHELRPGRPRRRTGTPMRSLRPRRPRPRSPTRRRRWPRESPPC